MTEIEKEKYPTAKVILYYALLGSLCGGILLAIFFIVVSGLSNFNDFFEMIVFCISIGSIVGFFPALITGAIIATLQITKNGWQVSLIGGLVSFICGMLCFKSLFEGIIILMIITGAISAVIVGKYALPKEE